ncbi:MAG: hypothetical protein ACRDRL_16655, partial [Sciscionella sp.]
MNGPDADPGELPPPWERLGAAVAMRHELPRTPASLQAVSPQSIPGARPAAAPVPATLAAPAPVSGAPSWRSYAVPMGTVRDGFLPELHERDWEGQRATLRRG